MAKIMFAVSMLGAGWSLSGLLRHPNQPIVWCVGLFLWLACAVIWHDIDKEA